MGETCGAKVGRSGIVGWRRLGARFTGVSHFVGWGLPQVQYRKLGSSVVASWVGLIDGCATIKDSVLSSMTVVEIRPHPIGWERHSLFLNILVGRLIE